MLWVLLQEERGLPSLPSRNMPLSVQLSGSSGRQLYLLLFRWERMTDKEVPSALPSGTIEKCFLAQPGWEG